ncbi:MULTISPECIES: ScpA family protein [unclassified Streptomyces]|uniref:segregation and condensation protein A n=1 Tax=unclassified Streptomyces TaxID=2593676 RepID=UPI0013BEA345|nr:segregation/condensation protein A [Streptomyces sp. CB09001]
MTSNDAPRPDRGPRPGRRRALGRGPGASAAPPLPGETPPGDGASGTTGAAPAAQDLGEGPAPTPAGASPASVGAPTVGRGEPAPVRETAGPETDERDPGNRHPGAPPTPGAEPGTGGPPDAGVSQEAPDDTSDDADDGVFKVRLANFEGPFDLLLQLISKHKMDVTEVALSKVTDEFMAHIRAMGPDWDLDQTTEFLVVAATLLDLKAARLLPAAEVEDEADLALLEARDLLFARLLQYRAYKQIAEIFNDRLSAEARRHPRTVGLEPHHAELLPEVVISIGPEGFAKLAVKAMQPKPKPQVYVEHIHAPLVSVQEQAGIVVARLKELGEASFRVLVQDTEDTLTVVARFLALLELYREKAVELDQETALGDLLVRWTGGDGETQPSVTDEFDRPPEAPKEEQKA